MSVLMSFLLPLRAEPRMAMKIRATMPMAPIRKNLECKIPLRLKPDLPLVDVTGLELSAI